VADEETSIRDEFENVWLSDDEQEAAPEEGTTATEEPEAEAPSEEEKAPEPDRPRDEKGRFIPEEKDELLLGKFRSADELAAAYQELESRFGTRGSELHELRQAVESLQESMPAQQPQAASYDWDSLIENSPQYAAQAAYETGDQFQLNRAVSAWEDLSPGTPAIWAEMQAMKALVLEMQEQVPQQLQPLIDQQQDAVTQQVLGEFYREHPDARDYAEQMADLMQQDPLAPRLVQVLEQGTPQEKVGVLSYLYKQARVSGDPQQADNLQKQAQGIAVEQAQLAEQAKLEAAVVSASNSNAGDPTTPDPADQMWEAWAGFDIGRLRNS